ncbi:MAG: hypothetical protein M0D55_10845 [Elusimicrobiota bacterium]|nr:MAG: hypothetical protein M0D55_10845 [Elusimicrobiota bacterium]
MLERDPRNTEAHFFLGHIQVNDEWLTEEQAKDAGLKEDNGYWYMPRARPTEARPGHGSRVTDAAIRKLALKPGNVVTVEYGPMSYASGEYHGRDARGLIRIETQRGDVFIDPGHVRTIRRATPLQAEYLTMKAATSSSDPEGLWALCLWADAHGMRAEALEAAKYYLVERPDDLDAARYIQTGGKSLSAPLPGGKPPSAN